MDDYATTKLPARERAPLQFCRECGGHLVSDARSCGACGVGVVSTTSAVGMAPIAGSGPSEASVPGGKHRRSRAVAGWAAGGFLTSLLVFAMEAGRGRITMLWLYAAAFFLVMAVVLPSPKLRTCPECGGRKLRARTLSKKMTCVRCKKAVRPVIG